MKLGSSTIVLVHLLPPLLDVLQEAEMEDEERTPHTTWGPFPAHRCISLPNPKASRLP